MHTAVRSSPSHVWAGIFFMFSNPLLKYRADFRRLAYETDDLSVNWKPWFVKETIILVSTQAMLDKRVPDDPEWSLYKSARHPERGAPLLDGASEEELLAAWRKRLTKARDFFRGYLLVYGGLFYLATHADGSAHFDPAWLVYVLWAAMIALTVAAAKNGWF